MTMTMQTLLIVYAAVVGLALGSFLNVCIIRIPAGGSVLRPRSRCPRCNRPLRWYENIPVLSFLALRGRCRTCGARISLQYPAVELLTGLVWVGSFLYYQSLWTALWAAIFVTLLIGIAVTDARRYIIPDLFSVGGLVLGLALALAPGPPAPLQALLGAALGFGLMYGVAVVGEWAFKKPALGGGDIKMMAMVGAFLGPGGVLLTIFAGSVIGSLAFGLSRFAWKGQAVEGAIGAEEFRQQFGPGFGDDGWTLSRFMLESVGKVPPPGSQFIHEGLMLEVLETSETAVERVRVRRLVPFGVFLAAGAVVVLLWGNAIIAWYTSRVLGL